jgi:hypothetical protein
MIAAIINVLDLPTHAMVGISLFLNPVGGP